MKALLDKNEVLNELNKKLNEYVKLYYDSKDSPEWYVGVQTAIDIIEDMKPECIYDVTMK